MAQEATQAIEKALQLDSQNPRGRGLAACLLADKGLCERAGAEARAALDRDSSDPWVRWAVLLVSQKCNMDVVPPVIRFISPQEGDTIDTRTELVVSVTDNSGLPCRVVVNRVVGVQGNRVRRLKEIARLKGEVTILPRDLDWSARGEQTIEVIATDQSRNTATARLKVQAGRR